MNEGVCIAIDVDPIRIKRRIKTRYLDISTDNVDEAIRLAKDAATKGQPLSIGLLGNAAEILPEMLEMDFIPDVLTDQTSAHDPLYGYIPANYTLDEAAELRSKNKKNIYNSQRKVLQPM